MREWKSDTDDASVEKAGKMLFTPSPPQRKGRASPQDAQQGSPNGLNALPDVRAKSPRHPYIPQLVPDSGGSRPSSSPLRDSLSEPIRTQVPKFDTYTIREWFLEMDTRGTGSVTRHEFV